MSVLLTGGLVIGVGLVALWLARSRASSIYFEGEPDFAERMRAVYRAPVIRAEDDAA